MRQQMVQFGVGQRLLLSRQVGSLSLLMLLLVPILAAGCATTSDKMPSAFPPQTGSAPVPIATVSQPKAVVAAQDRSSTGSLWSSTSGSLFRDIKATRIGDTITITVSEEAQAENKANTKTSRTHDLNASGSMDDVTLGGKSLLGGSSALALKGSMGNTFSGSGSTDRTNSITAVMTATVVDVLPNGNLSIRGSRWTKVNDELQQIILEGVVRPSDITRHNTVLSQNIADARIFIAGKGPISQYQKPGWLGQLLGLLNPF